MQSERSLSKTQAVKITMKSASSAAVTFQFNVFAFDEAKADQLILTSEQINDFRVMECGTWPFFMSSCVMPFHNSSLVEVTPGIEDTVYFSSGTKDTKKSHLVME